MQRGDSVALHPLPNAAQRSEKRWRGSTAHILRVALVHVHDQIISSVQQADNQNGTVRLLKVSSSFSILVVLGNRAFD